MIRGSGFNLFEITCIVGFVILFVVLPDIDLLGLCKHNNINNTGFALLLVLLAVAGIWLLKHSKILAILAFIIFFIVFKTQFRFVELFQDAGTARQDTQDAGTLDMNPLTAQETEIAKSFLIKQTEADPNKTKLEKEVIDGLINTYFAKSDKLKDLYNFDIASLVNTPLPAGSGSI